MKFTFKSNKVMLISVVKLFIIKVDFKTNLQSNVYYFWSVRRETLQEIFKFGRKKLVNFFRQNSF